MALRSSTYRSHTRNGLDHARADDDDDEIQCQPTLNGDLSETEDDLIDNYHYLTQHCGVIRSSPTTSILNAIQQENHKQTNRGSVLRQYSSVSDDHRYEDNDYERSLPATRSRTNCLPATIYYDDTEDDGFGDRHSRTFSIVRLFTRMKSRLKHDRHYRPKPTHEVLCEEDPHEWFELTKNVRTVLTKALLPDGGYDGLIERQRSQRRSSKKTREHRPVLVKDIDEDERIELDLVDELNTDGDEEFDEIIWQKFLASPRGYSYRRAGVCKEIDRQYCQGQLVYFYGVANNILIDENLKASGLG